MTRRIYLRREDRYMRAARLGDAPSILAASLERVSTVSKGQAVTGTKFYIQFCVPREPLAAPLHPRRVHLLTGYTL